MSNSSALPNDSRDPSNNDHTSFDILLGKQKAVFNHSGNKRFRSIVNYNVPKYMSAFTKSCKTQLVRDIHDDMKQAGFRFLKKRKGDDSPDTWHEIEESDAREKVSHALRDRVREIRKPNKHCKRSQQEISPMILAMSKIVFQNGEKAPCAMKIEETQGSTVTPQLTHNMPGQEILSGDQTMKQPLSYEYSCVPPSKSLIGTLQNTQHRPSLTDISAPTSTELERRYSLKLGEKGGSSLLLSVSRRSSMDTLFGGMAHEIADAKQSGLFSHRGSMFNLDQDNDSKHDADVPVKYITICKGDNKLEQDEVIPINHCESSGQSIDDKLMTKFARCQSMSSLLGSFDQKDSVLCSAKPGRRLSMLTLSLEDLTHSVYDRDCEVSPMPGRRMSMVRSSLDHFPDKANYEEDHSKSCRRLSMLSSFSGLEFL